MLKKYINVFYNIDSIPSSYDAQSGKKEQYIKSKTWNKIIEQFTLNIANNEVYEIWWWTKEKAESLENTTESLKKLLDTITPNKQLKGIYTALDTFFKTDKFSLEKATYIKSKLNDNWRKLLWPEYKNDPKAKEAIKIYEVIFLPLDVSVNDAVKIISEVFDDKNIPKWIKLKLVKYLGEWVLPYMITKTPWFEDIDYSQLDSELKKIYNQLIKYKWKSLSLEDHNKLFSLQDTLYSPKYKNNKNAQVLGDIISEYLLTYTSMLDAWKWIKILNKLIKKYPNYNWYLVYSFPQD